MRIFAVYVAILFMLTPMIAHGAIENGITLSDSEGVKIGEYEESTIVLNTIFDEGFKSVIFEIESSSESEIITVMLYNGMFDYPADLDEYYILADAEPADTKHTYGDDTTEIEIKIEPGVTSVEIFGKILEQDTESDNTTESIKVENVTESDSTTESIKVENVTESDSTTESIKVENVTESIGAKSMIECIKAEDVVESIGAEDVTICAELCPPGEISDGEKCVLVSNDLSFKDLIYGIAGSTIIALAISLLLAAISKISKRK